LFSANDKKLLQILWMWAEWSDLNVSSSILNGFTSLFKAVNFWSDNPGYMLMWGVNSVHVLCLEWVCAISKESFGMEWLDAYKSQTVVFTMDNLSFYSFEDNMYYTLVCRAHALTVKVITLTHATSSHMHIGHSVTSMKKQNYNPHFNTGMSAWTNTSQTYFSCLLWHSWDEQKR